MNFFQRFSSRFLTFFTSLWKYLYQYRKFAILWLGIVIFAVIGIALDLDKKAVTFLILIFGIISQAFIAVIGVISLIPVVGPILAKVLALPFFWILNSIGYFLSIIAIRRGYSKTVLDYRILTIVFLIGVAVGFIVGRLI